MGKNPHIRIENGFNVDLPHFKNENVDVIWTFHISKLKMWMFCGCYVEHCGGIWMFCGCYVEHCVAMYMFVQQCGCIVEQCGCNVNVMWNIVEECGCYVEYCEAM